MSSKGGGDGKKETREKKREGKETEAQLGKVHQCREEENTPKGRRVKKSLAGKGFSKSWELLKKEKGGSAGCHEERGRPK